MSPKYTISDYLEEVKEQFYSGQAKEHAYRPALKRLMSSFEDTVAVNDPKRSEHGNPDFIFIKASNQKIIRGYAEAKDIDVSLDKTEKTNQMERYHGYSNLFLTDYLEFRFFKNGEKYKTISLGHVQGGSLKLTPEKSDELARELKAFLELPPERIRSGRRLAEIMGGKARRIRDNVDFYLNHKDDTKNQELERIFEMMKSLLVHDLSREKFADMYAQTLVYGLFVARYSDSTPKDFSRGEARDLVPASNPFLRQFFDHIVGPNFDIRLGYIVDELCEVFSVSNVQEIVHNHLNVAEESTDTKDPIIHFYEDFLNEYDPLERKLMGAYYTPIPIVKYIVQMVDKTLKEDFGIIKGLASDEKFSKAIEVGQDMRLDRRTKKSTSQKRDYYRVQVLDPAVGTATFLNETIKFIHTEFKGQEGRWPAYVQENLVKRLHGFELMMAPYTIAHLKLAMTLKETGVNDIKERLGIYLTNTLEEGIPNQSDLFSFGLAEAVSDESRYAASIKGEQPIMVVMGNPPYSGVSSNETNYANELIKKYKFEPGGQIKLQEKKHWLNDDYVKFFAFAEDMIEKNGQGIVAMITNNGYLDNRTFRGMRWHLAKTFDKIYVLDLHGNTKKNETAKDGSKDENVFDIMQGVGIIIAMKLPGKQENKLADVYHGEIYGKRKYKFKRLEENINWQKLKLDEKFVYFVPKNSSGKAQYEQGIKIDDLFTINNIGICTQRDAIAIQRSKTDLDNVVEDLNTLPEDDFRQKYELKADGRDWKVATAIEDIKSSGSQEKYKQQIDYRLFDKRWTYYTGKSKGFMSYPRTKVFKHAKNGNLFLVACRQIAGSEFKHVFVTDTAFDQCLLSTYTKEGQYAFPLYLFHDDGTRSLNFNESILSQFTSNLRIGWEPEQILDYIYATLHSRKYRKKYNEFLRTDFPRVPIPNDSHIFETLSDLGRQLRLLHLMQGLNSGVTTTYTEHGDNYVDKLDYKDGDVWINNEQYFGNVPNTAWDFHMGGYQPAQKWLKDRKGHKLSSNDIDHYQKIINVLVRTNELMSEIDKYEIV